MKWMGLIVVALFFSAAKAQTAGHLPSVQAAQDPGEPAVLATCKNPPSPVRGPAPGQGAQPQPARSYTVTAIPGVVAAGQQWKFLWQELGNNGDGIVGAPDGSLLVAQNDNSQVVKLDGSGHATVAYSDTHTGGALSANKKGELFIVERGLRARIAELSPARRTVADSYQNEPLDCLGIVLNDLTADSKGGVYFTEGGLFYIDRTGKVTKYGESLHTNGIVMSPDEKTLYVTNGPVLASFQIQPDGSLINQKEFAHLDGGGSGDGSTVDATGRIYVTSAAGVQVIGPDGKYLGLIPTPRPVISVAFSGPNKKTLYILARGAKDPQSSEVANAAQVYAIPMLAQGFEGRAK